MRIVLGADHGGYQMKEKVKEWLKEDGYMVEDVGAYEEKKDDNYVDFAVLVSGKLREDGEARGVLFCRNGFGMIIAANRCGWIRCGLGFDKEAVFRGRNDDDINCLAIPSDYVNLEETVEMIKVLLKTSYSRKERYNKRLDKLGSIKW